MAITKIATDETSSSSGNDSDSRGSEPIDLSGLDQTRSHAMTSMYRREGTSDLNPNEERVLVYKEKTTTWKKVFGRRVMKSSHSTGEAITCALYILINTAALFVSPTYAYDVGLGSLSVGNTVFVFMTAARNSVLSWFVGIAFERVLVYHRFIGRMTVLLALGHSCFYAKAVIEKPFDPVILTGLVSLGCGFIIVLSSLNVIRRKHFNVFIWSHYSFVGFLVGVYLHAYSARPFIAASVACYSIDKGLQMMRKMPRQTTVFEKVDDRTAHIQFGKGTLSSLLGRHEVGQYVFVNFPSLSLKEWHPFSVASGPSEGSIDLYIRALGDHTKKIVEYAEHCAAENKQVKIRSDGPYGKLPFNYCRYGSILFVGGGIGITPIISILKDIYQSKRGSEKQAPKHCIKTVSVVWVMPHSSEASLFLDLLNTFHLTSLENPLVPNLSLSIHVTRDSADDATILGQQLVYSKPQFHTVMDECVENRPKESTSILVYACGPGGMVKQLWDASTKKNSKDCRVDFYHETFEF